MAKKNTKLTNVYLDCTAKVECLLKSVSKKISSNCLNREQFK